MIPPVPMKLRLVLAIPIMAVAVCLGTFADWIVPEMARDFGRRS